MNITTYLIVASVLMMHYLFDFVLQSHWMASNKGKRLWPLMSHVMVYTIGLYMVAIAFNTGGRMTDTNACWWLTVNMLAHFVTDFFTSRINGKLFGVNWHNFFVAVGGDQLIHYLTLFGTLTWLSGA